MILGGRGKEKRTFLQGRKPVIGKKEKAPDSQIAGQGIVPK